MLVLVLLVLLINPHIFYFPSVNTRSCDHLRSIISSPFYPLPRYDEPLGCMMASVKSFSALSTLSPFGGLPRSRFVTATATSRLMSASAVRNCKSMSGFFTNLIRRLRAKRPRSLTETVTTSWSGDREKSWQPEYFHAPNEFAIMLSHGNIVGSFFLSRSIEGM